MMISGDVESWLLWEGEWQGRVSGVLYAPHPVPGCDTQAGSVLVPWE